MEGFHCVQIPPCRRFCVITTSSPVRAIPAGARMGRIVSDHGHVTSKPTHGFGSSGAGPDATDPSAGHRGRAGNTSRVARSRASILRGSSCAAGESTATGHRVPHPPPGHLRRRLLLAFLSVHGTSPKTNDEWWRVKLEGQSGPGSCYRCPTGAGRLEGAPVLGARRSPASSRCGRDRGEIVGTKPRLVTTDV